MTHRGGIRVRRAVALRTQREIAEGRAASTYGGSADFKEVSPMTAHTRAVMATWSGRRVMPPVFHAYSTGQPWPRAGHDDGAHDSRSSDGVYWRRLIPGRIIDTVPYSAKPKPLSSTISTHQRPKDGNEIGHLTARTLDRWNGGRMRLAGPEGRGRRAEFE
jgi:hypothetical protein